MRLLKMLLRKIRPLHKTKRLLLNKILAAKGRRL
jgi:hypothetical protein